MGMPGRKSATEELKIAQRYSDLSDKFFKVLNKHLDSEDVEDQKWAVEQLSKGFVKMIPQQIGGDPDQPLKIIFDSTFTPPKANS